jgi:hypothetical protein
MFNFKLIKKINLIKVVQHSLFGVECSVSEPDDGQSKEQSLNLSLCPSLNKQNAFMQYMLIIMAV